MAGDGTERHSLPLERAALGAVLSFGSPLGWMALEWLGGTSPAAAWADHPGVYTYMGLGTLVVFALFGYAMGVQERKLLHLSIRDSLTGLYNGRFFHERLPAAYAQAARERRPLSLVQIDLDHFKQVNDQYGHRMGDQVLRAFGEVLAQSIRRGETAARVGGEEFCVILEGADIAAAHHAAERFMAAVREMRVPAGGGQELRMTASFGVASSELDGEDEWSLYNAADSALYAAKQAGRNRVCVYQKPAG